MQNQFHWPWGALVNALATSCLLQMIPLATLYDVGMLTTALGRTTAVLEPLHPTGPLAEKTAGHPYLHPVAAPCCLHILPLLG
jgi:hypothetical protein